MGGHRAFAWTYEFTDGLLAALLALPDIDNLERRGSLVARTSERLGIQAGFAAPSNDTRTHLHAIVSACRSRQDRPQAVRALVEAAAYFWSESAAWELLRDFDDEAHGLSAIPTARLHAVLGLLDQLGITPTEGSIDSLAVQVALPGDNYTLLGTEGVAESLRCLNKTYPGAAGQVPLVLRVLSVLADNIAASRDDERLAHMVAAIMDELDYPCYLDRRESVPEPEVALGRQGREALHEALAALGEAPQTIGQGPWTAQKLRRVEGELAGGPDSDVREWGRLTVKNALLALETASFLRSRHDLNSEMLRRAVGILRSSGSLLLPGGADRSPCRTEIEATESVAFDYPSDEPDCRPQMARLILLLLAPRTGTIEEAMDGSDQKRFQAWAESIGWLEINNASELVRGMQRDQSLRLVVSLHASIAGDWPESLEVWLRVDGRVHARESLALPSMDEGGAREALGAALSWARDSVFDINPDLQLRHLDIALPTPMLMRWRPEEIVVEGSRLGVHHDIVAHWSERLNPSNRNGWILQEALRRLARIERGTTGHAFDWLAEEQTSRLEHLSDRLGNGDLMCAVGLDHHPGQHALELLFSYVPIVIWPESADEFPASLRSRVDRSWDALAVTLPEAYRARWRDQKSAEDLAHLRIVWDDHDWLRFCRETYRLARIRDSGSTP